MSLVLLDTHAWAWALLKSAHLSRSAKEAVVAASTVLISPISLYEIGQKVRLGKRPEMAPHLDRLSALVGSPGLGPARLDAAVRLAAGRLKWGHRDPFDRLLAATALAHQVPIVSADPVFDGIVRRIW